MTLDTTLTIKDVVNSEEKGNLDFDQLTLGMVNQIIYILVISPLLDDGADRMGKIKIMSFFVSNAYKYIFSSLTIISSDIG